MITNTTENENVSVSDSAQSISVQKASKINITDNDCLRNLISHIESNILGKLPEILRYFSHLALIFDIITQRGNILGSESISLLEIELGQIQTIFSKDPKKLQKVILSNDRKQYDQYVTNTNSRKHQIENFKIKLETLLVDLKKTLIKSVEHTIKPYEIPKLTNKYIDTMKKLNHFINDINIHCQPMPWIIKPNDKQPQSKQKSFLCAAGAFNLPQEQYKELIEDDIILISVHKASRRFKCTVNKAGLETLINKCLETAFPKIESNTTVKLQATCPCIKSCGTVCGSIVSIDDLVESNGLEPIFKLKILDMKSTLIKKNYGIDIFIKCPKPNCPNGDGFPITDVLSELIQGSFSSHYSPIHKCNLCDSVWCSKCGKSHPGRLCADEDDDELGPDAKKCPKCKLPTSRDSGCFHMNCTRCSVHWCWDCNHFTPQSNAYAHTCVKGNWVSVDPVIDGSVIIGPVIDGSVIVDPVIVDPVIVDPVIVDPVIVDPVIVGPVIVDPVIVGPVIVDPVIVGPVIVDPVIVEIDTEVSVVVEQLISSVVDQVVYTTILDDTTVPTISADNV